MFGALSRLAGNFLKSNVGGVLKGVGSFASNFLKNSGALSNLGGIARGITKAIPQTAKYADMAGKVGDFIGGGLMAGNLGQKIKEKVKGSKAEDLINQAGNVVQAGKDFVSAVGKGGDIAGAGRNFIDQAKKTWSDARQTAAPVVESMKDKRTLNALQEASQIFTPK